MGNDTRTIYYDNELKIEAYWFKGVRQKFPNHFHDHYVVGFIENGQRAFLCKDREYILRPGDILLLNPMDNHTCWQLQEDPLDYRCLNIPPETMQAVASEIRCADNLPVFCENVLVQSDLADSLRELHLCIVSQDQDFKKDELFLFLIEQLLHDCACPNAVADRKQTSQTVWTICRFLDEHYAEAISLNQLSSLVGISKYHLLHSFTRQKGISPYNYLETVRISRAKKLLEQGISPLDVAIKTGFHDQSHFTNLFKKFIGLTPRQYGDIFRREIENGAAGI